LKWFSIDKRVVELKKVVADNVKKLKEQDAKIKFLDKAVDEYKLIDRPKWDSSKIEKKRFGYFEKRALNKHPEITYFISMVFPNGTYKELVVRGDRKFFYYGGRMFTIDTKETTFDLNQNQFRLLYHFNETMPVQLDVRTYTNPGMEKWLNVKSDNARPVFQQEYVKNVASANEISLFFKINLILSGIGLFLTFVLCIVVGLMAAALNHLIKALS